MNTTKHSCFWRRSREAGAGLAAARCGRTQGPVRAQGRVWGRARVLNLGGESALRAPRCMFGFGCHLRGGSGVSNGATPAISSCSQRWTCKFTGALRGRSRRARRELRLHRPSRACGGAVGDRVACASQDHATSRRWRSTSQNVTFGRARVKTRTCQNTDNMALLGPSLMLHASRARCTKRANSDCATAKFGRARARVCNDSPSKVTS